MASYAEVAVQAVVKLRAEPQISAREAWTMAVAETFPNSISMQEKGCTRTIFLTLYRCLRGEQNYDDNIIPITNSRQLFAV
jgi:hypothetical protein